MAANYGGAGGGGGAYAKGTNLDLSFPVPFNIAIKNQTSGSSFCCNFGRSDNSQSTAANTVSAQCGQRPGGVVGQVGGAGGLYYYPSGYVGGSGGSPPNQAQGVGAGGGGAAGPNGAGGNAANSTTTTASAGGTANGGTVAGGVADGGAGISGTQWDATHGSGSGGGGAQTKTAGSGGSYGGGGGGASSPSFNTIGEGSPGVIVITYSALQFRRCVAIIMT
jgi:hypothetical protein